MNKEIRYESAQHQKILDALQKRVDASGQAINKKTSDFNEGEDIFAGYIHETEADKIRKAKRDDGEPKFTTMKVPFSYAVLMSAHTYWTSALMGRDPVMQFAGRHGEGEDQIQAVEAVMGYQTDVGEHLLPYYLWLLDVGKYGAGILGNYWDEEFVQTSEIVEEPVTYLGIPMIGKTRKVKRTRRVPGYAGNRVFNVRPLDFIFDGRVTLGNFQDGEFAGRFTEISWNDVVRRAEAGQYYNIETLKKMKRNKSAEDRRNRDQGSQRVELPDGANDGVVDLDDMSPTFVNAYELVVELIPRDWGLGSSNYPEKWVFTVAEDALLIESQPFSPYHGKFPFSVLEYEMEAYGQFKRGLLDMSKPLEDTMEWLINTHFFNVRQTLNGQFIMDPSRLTVKDFTQEAPGRMIRIKPAGYGQDIRTMFQQIQTVDVTQNHLKDAGAVSELIQRITGVTDNIMGMVNQGGRKSATEIRQTNTSGANRLKTQVEFFSASGWSNNARQLLQNTQQYYDMEQKFRIAGDTQNEMTPFATVTPDAIAGFYDFIPVDGTMPQDKLAQVTMWGQLLQQMQRYPQVMQEYDIGRIFGWIAQLGGLTNIKRFRVQVAPDEMLGNEVDKGNLIPMGDVNDGAGARGAGGNTGQNPGGAAGVPGAARVSSLGPIG